MVIQTGKIKINFSSNVGLKRRLNLVVTLGDLKHFNLISNKGSRIGVKTTPTALLPQN